MTIEQGDIFRVDLDDTKGSKPEHGHPHVVIQNNVFNKSRINTVAVCAVTYNLKRAATPGNVLLKKGEAGIAKDSVINISQIVTVNKSDLVQKIGQLSRARIKQVIDGVKLLIEPRDII